MYWDSQRNVVYSPIISQVRKNQRSCIFRERLRYYKELANKLPYQKSIGSLIKRNTCPEVFWRKSVLTKFASFTGIHLCQGLFFNPFSVYVPLMQKPVSWFLLAKCFLPIRATLV